MAHSYSWIVGSGTWNAAGDWADLTTGTSPATSFPGAADTAAITGPMGNTSYLVTGPGTASVLSLLGFVAVGGSLSAGSVTSGAIRDGGLEVLPGATLSAGSLVATSVSLSVDGASALLGIGGLLTLAGFTSTAATNGGVVTTATLSVTSGALGVDATGRIEIGGAGTGAAGAITVDAGAVASVVSNFYGPLVVNGLINGRSAFIHGPVSGSGTIAAITEIFQGGVGAGLRVSVGSTGEMTIQAPASFAATIAGFAPGQLIAVSTPGVNALAYAGTSAGGTLTLQKTGTTVAALTLAGNYLSSSFLLLPFGGIFANDQIAVTTNAATAAAAAPTGPGNADAYTWKPTTGGAWNLAGNWTDATTGLTATSSPGSLNPVTISSAVYGYQVVNGSGNAAALTTRGDTALNGVFRVASLTNALTFNSQPSTLVVMPGSTLAVAGTADIIGELDADAGTVTVGGVLILDGASYVTNIQSYAGGLVQLGGLTGAASGQIIVDGTGRVEIGSAGGAAAGALTVDAGITAPLVLVTGNVVDNGTITVAAPVNYSSGSLTGNLSGSGLLQIAAGATADLNGTVGSGITIAFGAGGVLDLGVPGSAGALLTGFATGDLIGIVGEIAAVSYSAGSGTLVLTGTSATTLGSLTLSGSFAGSSFLPLNTALLFQSLIEGVVVLAAGTLQTGATPAPDAGTTTPDAYSFTANGGAWNTAANWSDVTKAQTPAAVAAGALDAVTIADSTVTPGRWQVISGSGQAASTTVNGNVALSGSFALGALVVNATTLSNYQVVGALDVTAGAVVTASSASVLNGLMVTGAGARLIIGGTLGLGSAAANAGGSTLDATGGASVQAARLAELGTVSYLNDVVFVDAASTIEIGGAGGALAGALNIDPGITVSAFSITIDGALNNRGTITVGNSADPNFAGAITGSGSIVLGNNVSASFGAAVAASQTIVLGANDSLNFSGGTTPTLLNFTPGDILTFSSADVTGAVWSAGMLSLSSDGVPFGSVALPGNYAGARFITTQAPGGSGIGSSAVELISAGIACFAEGTRIATDRGLVAVEHLRVGDRVRSAFGGSAPVRWLGHRRIDGARHRRPRDVSPVRIAAHAFGPLQPARTLWLSPDHAVHVDGVLIPARYLVNGASIVQEAARAVTYWHVELPAHDVLLAEGLACESYLDTGNRSAFAGAATPMLHADFARGVWAAEGCAALVTDGPLLASVRRRLLARAIDAGHRITPDPALLVVADGNPLLLRIEGDAMTCLVPAGTRQLRLLSRRWTPAEMAAGADSRDLGVAVAGLWRDGQPIALDDPRLGAGWHAAEADWRWTDGDAVLHVTGMLRLTLARLGRYWADAPNCAGHRHG